MTPSDQIYVTQEDCEVRHRTTKWLLSTVLVLCAMFVAMNGWSLVSSQQATAKAAQAAADLAVMGTGQDRDIQHLQNSIAELKVEIRALRSTLDRLATRDPRFSLYGGATNDKSIKE
jgi:uncharacterized protein HemX